MPCALTRRQARRAVAGAGSCIAPRPSAPSATAGTIATSGRRRVVARSDRVARRDLVREDLELLDQDRGLDGVEPAVHADAHVVVFVAALAVHAQRPQHARPVRRRR